MLLPIMVSISWFILSNLIGQSPLGMEPFYPGERLIANSVVMHGNKTILTNNTIS